MDNSRDLIARVERGDKDAFRLIFEQHHRFIFRFLYGMVGDYGLAEELTQETFIRVYKSINTLRDETKLTTWLCSIAKNIALNSFRSHRAENRVMKSGDELADVEGGESPDKQVFNTELKHIINAALRSLDNDKRLVFTLKVMQQKSYEEIAEITGFTVPKLKTDLFRAKAEMRRLIKPYLEARDEV